MRLTPHEQERLLIHVAAGLAEQRRARGLRLNLPEATALITSYLLEGARDGRSVAELMAAGRQVLGPRRAAVPASAGRTCRDLALHERGQRGPLAPTRRPVGQTAAAFVMTALPAPTSALSNTAPILHRHAAANRNAARRPYRPGFGRVTVLGSRRPQPAVAVQLGAH